MNHLKRISLFLFACISLTIFASSCKSGSENKVASDGSVDLKLNFKPGDKFLYATRAEQKIESIAAMSQTMQMDMIYNCTGDSAGTKKLTITYDHVSMSMVSPMGQIEYDSKKPNAHSELNLSAFDSLIGKSFNIWVAPDGSVTKIEGLGEMMNAVGQDGSESRSAAGSFLTDTSIRAMMQTSFDIFPGKSVKVGDTWKKKTQASAGNSTLNVESTYTLKSIDGGKAVLGITSTLNLPQTGMGPEGAGMQMEMNGKQEGTLDIDIATGQMLSGNIKQDIKGNMVIKGMNQPMPLNIIGTITITSKKL